MTNKPPTQQNADRDERFSDNRRKAVISLLAYARPYRVTFLAVMSCALFAISADLLQPYLVKVAIDDGLLTGEHGGYMLMMLSVTYLLLAVIGLVFTYLQANLLQKAGQGIVSRLRKDLFAHISRLSMSFFDRHPIGALVTNVSSDTEMLNQFFTQMFLTLVRDGLALILIMAFMFYLDPVLALYCLCLLPIIFVIAIAFRKVLRTSYQQTRAQLSRLIAFLAENLAGMNLIQTFHQEKEQTKRFTENNQNYLRNNLREVRTSVMFNRSFDILGNVSIAFLVWIGGLAVFHKQMEFGVLYAFISYIRQFFQPINHITQQWNTFQSTMVSMERLWRVFSVQPEVLEPTADKRIELDPTSIKGRIEFKQIHFSYLEDQDVLVDLNLRINPGEFIGIVGTTGAGKSSLVNLLTRFYDVKQGSITIDGVDIRKLPLELLHRIVGLVQQEPYLFSGTIIDNVRLFNETITAEEVVRACNFVGAHSVIQRLKNGYDTRLSERGSGLSAGERQLISFARIVVFQPKILILDEATANLDSHTERLIQSALQSVSHGRTTLVIAHRLSTIVHADRIIVMREGRIVEEGKHETLLRQNGYYADLVHHSRSLNNLPKLV